MKLPAVEQVASTFASVADMYIIYITEAHAVGEWSLESNDALGVCMIQPKTTEQRIAYGRQFEEDLQPQCKRVLVDDISNEVSTAYEARPERLYVLYKGKVAYRGGMGPFKYKPAELHDFLTNMFPTVTTDVQRTPVN